MALKDLPISAWVQELEAALKFRQKYGREDAWPLLEAKIAHAEQKIANSGPNILVSTLDALTSALNVPSPYLTVKARNSRSVQTARVVESVDNMLIDAMNFQYEVDYLVANSFSTSRGIMKIGYDSEFGWDDTLDIGMTRPLGMSLTQHDRKMSSLLEYNNVKSGMPWVQSVRSQDFLVPWGTRDIPFAPWCMHRIVRHIDAIKSDLKYSNTRDLQPGLTMEDWVRSYQFTGVVQRAGPIVGSSNGRDREYVELWEIHDRRTGRIKVMASGYDKWLRDEISGLQTTAGLPFVSLSMTPRSPYFWSTPDAFYLLFHQNDLSDIAVQTTIHRRLLQLKLLGVKEAFDKDTLQQLLDGKIGSFVPIKDGYKLNEVLMPFLAPTPNLQLYADAEQTRRNAREMVGFSQNQIGEFEQTGRRTATEAQIVQQGAGLRLDRRQNQLRSLYCDAFQIINNIITQQWKTPKIVDIIGQDGIPQWQQITGDQLKGDFDYKLGFSIGGNESLQERRQTALQMFLQLAQTGVFDPAALAQFLANAWNDPEFSATFKPGILNGQQTQSAQFPPAGSVSTGFGALPQGGQAPQGLPGPGVGTGL